MDDPQSDQDELSDSDSGQPAEESSKSRRRKNKHAPSESSSKHHVSWIRDIPGLKKQTDSTLYRDVRFDPTYGKADLAETRKNYAFLNEYRQQEMDEMKNQLKKSRNEGEKHRLQLDIQSLQSRLNTFKQRDFEHQVLTNFKKDHKNYHLKRSEKRKLILTEKFKSMKKKDIGKVIERKRKKNAAKERKSMPLERRA